MTLKHNKILLGSLFPIQCGSFLLENFNHANKELLNLESLMLHTLPKRKFDRENVAKNVSITLNLKPYVREAQEFKDILQSAELF